MCSAQAVHVADPHHASAPGHTIGEDRARPANTDPAAELRTGQPEMFTQEEQQQLIGPFWRDGEALTIEIEGHEWLPFVVGTGDTVWMIVGLERLRQTGRKVLKHGAGIRAAGRWLSMRSGCGGTAKVDIQNGI